MRRRPPRVLLFLFLIFTSVFLLTISPLLRFTLPLSATSRLLVRESFPNYQSLEETYADRPWFMRGGLIRPSPQKSHGPRPILWPHESETDRIVNHLMYVPHGYNGTVPLKKILLYFGRNGWSDLPLGRAVFLRDNCPVDTCTITTNVREAQTSHLILFKDKFVPPKYSRHPDQIWMLFLLECPQNTPSFVNVAGIFNWTATYRHDSDIVAPYEKFVPYPSAPPNQYSPGLRNYAEGKKKKVAWFVSNCHARSRRLQYALQLSRFIKVDIFGKCGPLQCPRSFAKHCFQLLNRDYKFYLAFENSNCKDYITEKFFVNGLGHDVLPIVMGARPQDYLRSAPPHSYIHVEDFPSPKALADYLHELDRNDTLYNSYFQWKHTGEFINTRFWCRLCSLLHAPQLAKVYIDLKTWWSGPGTCTKDRWAQED